MSRLWVAASIFGELVFLAPKLTDRHKAIVAVETNAKLVQEHCAGSSWCTGYVDTFATPRKNSNGRNVTHYTLRKYIMRLVARAKV